MWIPEHFTKAQLSAMSFALLETMEYNDLRANMARSSNFFWCFSKGGIINSRVEQIILNYRMNLSNVIRVDRNRKFTKNFTREMFVKSFGSLSRLTRPEQVGFTTKLYIRPFVVGDKVFMERNSWVSNETANALYGLEFIISKIDYKTGRVYSECGLGDYVPIHLNFLHLMDYSPHTLDYIKKERIRVSDSIAKKKLDR